MQSYRCQMELELLFVEHELRLRSLRLAMDRRLDQRQMAREAAWTARPPP